ncbi:MAG: response regulator [Calditrichia bacterium]
MAPKILVVDDEQDVELLINSSFRKKIKSGELSFQFAYDGVQALEKLHADPHIDVVLSDINMPRMDGLTLTSRIQEEAIRAKVIIVSAYSDMINIRQAMNLGAFDFVTKPLDLEDLEKTLYKVLVHHSQAFKEENVELNAALRELRQTQQQLVLQEKMASLGSLVAGIAHEINTPVGVINSSVDTISRCVEKLVATLNDSTLDPEIEKRVEKLFRLLNQNAGLSLSAGHRVAGVVSSLKNFARLDQEEFQPANLNEGIESILVLLAGKMENIQVKTDLAALPLLYCSPGQINQVFMSLLVNSIQATSGTGEISVTSRHKENQIELLFTDTGIGMSPELVKSVFDFRFTKVGARVKMGIGLASAYNIIQKHGGTIRLESEPGKGTRVCIELPLVHENKTKVEKV